MDSVSEELRKRQISGLLNAFPSQLTVLQPSTLYSISIIPEVTLIIYLPAEFPLQPPILSTCPALQHTWMDERGFKVVGHEYLRRWDRHLAVGQLVRDVSIEFKLRPPMIIREIRDFYDPITELLPVEDNKVIDKLPTERISELLESPEAFEEFLLNSIPSMKLSAKAIEDSWQENERFANRNLRLKGDLHELKQKLREAQNSLNATSQSLANFLSLHSSLLKKYSPNSIAAELDKRVEELEEESGNREEAVKDEEQLNRFVELRMQVHRLSILTQKLK